MKQSRNTLRILFCLASLALLTACGDDNDKRLSDADVACLKLLRAGSSCSSVNTTTATVTATATTTTTATSTVTVTSTQ